MFILSYQNFYINIITQDVARKNVLPVALNPLFLFFYEVQKSNIGYSSVKNLFFHTITTVPEIINHTFYQFLCESNCTKENKTLVNPTIDKSVVYNLFEFEL